MPNIASTIWPLPALVEYFIEDHPEDEQVVADRDEEGLRGGRAPAKTTTTTIPGRIDVEHEQDQAEEQRLDRSPWKAMRPPAACREDRAEVARPRHDEQDPQADSAARPQCGAGWPTNAMTTLADLAPVGTENNDADPDKDAGEPCAEAGDRRRQQQGDGG